MNHFIRKGIKYALPVAFSLIAFNIQGCQSNTKDISTQIPDHPIENGISAPFAGCIGNYLLVGGGCNFPGISAADGGKKVYYSSLFALNLADKQVQWKALSDLPLPVAYGATVEMPEGLICIGGMNEKSSLNLVFLIARDTSDVNKKSSDQFNIVQLPALPETIDNASATHIGQSVYVTGGNQDNGGNSLYTLNLKSDTIWTKLSDYPGAKRVQPVLLASNEELYLFGGFDVQKKKGIISSNFIVYNIKEDTWSHPQSIPTMKDGSERALVGCAGTRVNDRLILAGGVNYSIFKAAIEGKAPSDYMRRLPEWYQFSKDILVYDLPTKSWSVIPEEDGFNKAGGSLIYHQGDLYMICGEIKPGIRTNQIFRTNLKDILLKDDMLPR